MEKNSTFILSIYIIDWMERTAEKKGKDAFIKDSFR